MELPLLIGGCAVHWRLWQINTHSCCRFLSPHCTTFHRRAVVKTRKSSNHPRLKNTSAQRLIVAQTSKLPQVSRCSGRAVPDLSNGLLQNPARSLRGWTTCRLQLSSTPRCADARPTLSESTCYGSTDFAQPPFLFPPPRPFCSPNTLPRPLIRIYRPPVGLSTACFDSVASTSRRSHPTTLWP